MGRGDAGTILRAWINQDGVTHVHVKTDALGVVGRSCYGPLQVRGEPLDDLPGLQVRSIGDGVWVLTKGRAAT